MSKKKKQPYVDDGHTVYSMDGVDGPIWKRKKSQNNAALSGKERRAAIKAAFQTFAPIFFGVLACFSATALLLFFWLKH